jgi:hypothetical protein
VPPGQRGATARPRVRAMWEASPSRLLSWLAVRVSSCAAAKESNRDFTINLHKRLQGVYVFSPATLLMTLVSWRGAARLQTRCREWRCGSQPRVHVRRTSL